jgi:hypothetical protein
MIRGSSSNVMPGSGSSACEILDAKGNLRDVAPASNADFSGQWPKVSLPGALGGMGGAQRRNMPSGLTSRLLNSLQRESRRA